MSIQPWMLPAAAVVLDLCIGDPHQWPHPVRWMGRLITAGEPVCRRLMPHERTAGALLAVITVGAAWGGTAVLITVTRHFLPVVSLILTVYFLYTTLAVRDLCVHGKRVAAALEHDDLAAARKAVGMMVGRDTAHLGKAGISRAAIESLAENFVDGVLSPLFFIMLGGAPLAMAFKAVSTLDSMIGYRNNRYRRFGTFAARLDDAVNWIPARLSPLLIAVSAIPGGGSPWNTLRTAWYDGDKHDSPNSGISEAAMAGALGIRLGGPTEYGGKTHVHPYIGSGDSPNTKHIRAAVRIVMAGSLVGAGTVCAVLAVCA